MLKYSLFSFVNGSVLNALNAVANLIRFCSYASSVGVFYPFANAVYIFANIGANAEMLVFCFCECSIIAWQISHKSKNRF